MLYLFLRDTHNLLRWIVILACLWALLRLVGGLFKRSRWTKRDQFAGLVFTSFLNVQVLLGLILYSLSPITRSALPSFGAAMKDSLLRFYLVEHLAGMFLAAVINLGFAHSREHPMALHEVRPSAFPILRRLRDLKNRELILS